MNRPDHHPMDRPGKTAKHRLRLWLGLLKLTRSIEADLRDRLRAGHQTTLPRFDVMAALDRSPQGLKMSELSGALKVSNGNVTGIVDRLVSEGHVERVPVEGDRRAMLVRLTGTGRRVFKTQAAEHERWVDTLLSGVDHDEAEALATRLREVASALEQRSTAK